IYGFDLSKNHPPVQQLQLHLPDMHMVTYHKRDKIERVVKRPGADESMLIAYFDYNRLHEEALGILYRDFPEHYTWESNGKFWKPRKNAIYQVGRLVSAHPAEGERYFLRVLLNHVAGATSYRDLRTVDGVLLPSFREAAERRGLIEEDNTLDECLTENNLFHMPSSLRRLFATILVFCEPNDVFGLWTKHLDAMLEDYRRNNPNPSLVEQMVLIDIRNMLQSMGKDIRSFPLLGIDDAYDNASGIPREIFEEASIDQDLEDRAAYEEIMSKVDTEQGGLFFVDGLGGTGKTFLYRALLETLHNQNKLAIATATSGVAASIMPGGRTAYSRFKIPLTLEDGGCCSFTKQSGTAKLLQQASLIIWDEASMAKRQAMEALDNSLRDIMGRQDLPFGGKTVVFGGDFRQVLLVVRKGSRAQIVDASLWRSYLWESMHHLKLVRNMRAQSDPWFAEYLLRIGGGTEEVNGDGDKDLDRLIECIFPNLNANMTNKDYITSRAILSTRNDWVDNINIKMIGMFQGGEMVYHSFDSAIDDPHNYYPSEFLNTLTPNGLPPHLLKLKIGCPVILLRNIDPANGLCNGTRLVHAGKRVFLPRIPLCPSDDEMFPFQFKRKQFPIRLSFAMTVNKSQGQTIPNVGVYLPAPVLSHGQLYVAMSRATARTNIKILALPPNAKADEEQTKKKEKKTANKKVNGQGNQNNNEQKGSSEKKKRVPTVDGTYTKNIVYKEVLTP
uniref:ATP-dependent DNA helicase n=1 Tax=Setaria italica TaxID=4555 RepID=K3XRZ7_SETIT